MKKIFVFGEVLFDVYPDKAVMGGAPFNFCANLAQLGNETALISAVGRDGLAEKVKDKMNELHIDKSWLNTVDYPTGVCCVTLSESGVPQYDLRTGQAYDNIVLDEAQLEKIRGIKEKCLYFGTLAQRNPVSESTLKKLLRNCDFDDIYYDINIRSGCDRKDIIDEGLKYATVLKFSREESGIFSRLGIDENTEAQPLCKALAGKYKNIKYILLTLDKDGAVVYDASKDSFASAKAPDTHVVSTVGAGDSFFAGYVHSSLHGKSADESLAKGVKLSSYVVSCLEAVPCYGKDFLS